MKILLLTDYFLPHAGGARVYYYNLYRNLVNHFSHSVTVLTKKVKGWKEFDLSNGNDSLRIIRHFKPLSTWKYHELPKILFPLLEALYLVSKQHIDMVHFGDLYPQGVISLLLKKYYGIPYLAYCHGEEITQTDRFRYQPGLRNRIYGSADAVVAANSFARENLMRIGIAEERIHTITPGVDCSIYDPNANSQTVVRRFCLEGKLVLLTVGRMCRRKNHAATLRAIHRILPDIPNLAYLVVGHGEEEQELRRLTAELNLEDIVTFVGYVPDEELRAFYAVADVFVMPNREESSGDVEGFGMVFLEANACGKVVVGGRSGGTAEAIIDGETGVLINPDDHDELAAILKFLLLNPELRLRMGNAGLRRARSHYRWLDRARILHDVTVNTCGRKSGSGTLAV